MHKTVGNVTQTDTKDNGYLNIGYSMFAYLQACSKPWLRCLSTRHNLTHGEILVIGPRALQVFQLLLQVPGSNTVLLPPKQHRYFGFVTRVYNFSITIHGLRLFQQCCLLLSHRLHPRPKNKMLCLIELSSF